MSRLGAMIARDDIVEAVLDAGGFIHGYTYAGNPLACAAGLAVLNEIEQTRSDWQCRPDGRCAGHASARPDAALSGDRRRARQRAVAWRLS